HSCHLELEQEWQVLKRNRLLCRLCSKSLRARDGEVEQASAFLFRPQSGTTPGHQVAPVPLLSLGLFARQRASISCDQAQIPIAGNEYIVERSGIPSDKNSILVVVPPIIDGLIGISLRKREIFLCVSDGRIGHFNRIRLLGAAAAHSRSQETRHAETCAECLPSHSGRT